MQASKFASCRLGFSLAGLFAPYREDPVAGLEISMGSSIHSGSVSFFGPSKKLSALIPVKALITRMWWLFGIRLP